MSRHPEYPVNAYLKATRKRGLWGVRANGPDHRTVNALNRRILAAPKFRMPWELAAAIKGDNPYAGVRMPYPEMVVEFEIDPPPPLLEKPPPPLPSIRQSLRCNVLPMDLMPTGPGVHSME